ncbi:toprim domain-containing protein, partial [Ruminococcus sp.]
NVVFVGFDDKNEAKFAESKVTNTFYKRKPKNVSGSQKEYSFNLTYLTPESNKDTVYVFEAPVDLLSHATMYVISEKKRAERLGQKPDYDVWKKQNRLSLSGTSDVALQSYLQRYPEIKNIVLCLDNDEAGRNGIAKVNQKYADRYSITVHVPKLGKDYNETLVRYLTVAEKATEQRTVDNSEEVAVTNTTQRSR